LDECKEKMPDDTIISTLSRITVAILVTYNDILVNDEGGLVAL
jgi:hypothetical protein